MEEKKMNSQQIEGRNAVMEAFRSGKPIDKVYILDGCQDGPIRSIVREAKKHDTILNFVTKERLNQISETGRHQGVIAQAAAYEYAQVEDMLELAKQKGEDPFLILLDNIEDPHNLGAIIRTANLAGAHGVIIPKRSRSYCNRCKDIGRCAELHTGSKSHQSGENHGRTERKGTLVRLCRYGWGCDVPRESERTDWSGDRKRRRRCWTSGKRDL